MHNFIIFDIDSNFIREAQRLAKYGINVMHIDVKNLINTTKVDAIVSPANSFGFMNGGIDQVYSEIFNDIEKNVRDKIKMLDIVNNDGQCYLPVCSAITVKTNNSKCPLLICNPTMYMPGSEVNNNNIFYCFISLIYLSKRNPNMVIACPGLGTGIGMVSAKSAIDQIEMAIFQYDTIIRTENYKKTIRSMGNYSLIIMRNYA